MATMSTGIWLLSNLVLYPQYFPDIFHHIGTGRLNDSLWAVPVQISFYLVLPAIYWFYKRFGFKKMILCSIAVSAFSVLVSYVALKFLPGNESTAYTYIHSCRRCFISLWASSGQRHGVSHPGILFYSYLQ